MAESLFDIVFRGDIVPGENIQDVKARLGQLFKVDAAKVDALFAGGAVPLKRKVDQSTAEKYKAVLTKAGAQVQIRPAGGASKADASVRPAPRPVAQAAARTASTASERDPAPSLSAGATFTLAPPGENLLSPSETRQVPILELDLSAISVKPMEGDLLEDAEKTKPVVADIPVGDYGVADAGADLLEGFRREELPLPEIDPEFDIAEVGADLLEAADRRRTTVVEVDTDHLSVVPLDDSAAS